MEIKSKDYQVQEGVKEPLNKLSPRRTPGSRCLIWLDSGVRRNDVVDLFSIS